MVNGRSDKINKKYRDLGYLRQMEELLKSGQVNVLQGCRALKISRSTYYRIRAEYDKQQQAKKPQKGGSVNTASEQKQPNTTNTMSDTKNKKYLQLTDNYTITETDILKKRDEKKPSVFIPSDKNTAKSNYTNSANYYTTTATEPNRRTAKYTDTEQKRRTANYTDTQYTDTHYTDTQYTETERIRSEKEQKKKLKDTCKFIDQMYSEKMPNKK